MLWINTRLAAAWRYSRTIFLNVASILALGLQAFVAYAVGADWASIIHNPTVLFCVTMGINAANIYLRTQTTAAVGKKPVEGS